MLETGRFCEGVYAMLFDYLDSCFLSVTVKANFRCEILSAELETFLSAMGTRWLERTLSRASFQRIIEKLRRFQSFSLSTDTRC